MSIYEFLVAVYLDWSDPHLLCGSTAKHEVMLMHIRRCSWMLWWEGFLVLQTGERGERGERFLHVQGEISHCQIKIVLGHCLWGSSFFRYTCNFAACVVGTVPELVENLGQEPCVCLLREAQPMDPNWWVTGVRLPSRWENYAVEIVDFWSGCQPSVMILLTLAS